MNTLLSPVQVETLLDCYYRGVSASEHEHSSACVSAIRFLENIEAVTLDQSRSEWVTTDLGRAWVRSICDTPMPEPRYVDPRTDEVIDS